MVHRKYFNHNIVFNRGTAKSMDFFLSMEPCTYICIQKYTEICLNVKHFNTAQLLMHKQVCTTCTGTSAKQTWRRSYSYRTCSMTITLVKGFEVNTQLIQSDSEVILCYLWCSRRCSCWGQDSPKITFSLELHKETDSLVYNCAYLPPTIIHFVYFSDLNIWFCNLLDI